MDKHNVLIGSYERSPKLLRRRRRRGISAIKNPSVLSDGVRRNGPATPLLRWKNRHSDPSPKRSRTRGENEAGEETSTAAEVAVSARRLAAGLWHLQENVTAGSGGGWDGKGVGRLGFENNLRYLHFLNFCDHNRTCLHAGKNTELGSSISAQCLRNGIYQKMGSSSSFINCMENVTKWDIGTSKSSDEAWQFSAPLKLLADQQVTTVSLVSALQAELVQARNHINELENERRSAKKKLDQFLKKIAEEKASWRSKEHEKVRNVIHAIKDDLNKERKSRHRIEILNSKVVTELAEAKLAAKRYLHDYEKERKARELMEEVCDELAKEIGQDRAEVEDLKRESMKFREEMEEERRMLQMAEVWREERVQMKLIDAKLTLEEKYLQICKLRANIEAFMSAHGGAIVEESVIKEAEMLSEAVDLVKIQDIKEFYYKPPPASEDIFSVFEELRSREMTNDRETGQCYEYSSASRASKIHTVSPETDVFLDKPKKRHANGIIDMEEDTEDMEDESGWETASHVEEQASCVSPEMSEAYVNDFYEESHASVSGAEWDDNGHDKLNSEISEICSATTRQSRKQGFSIGRTWIPSSQRNGENRKVSVELLNERLSNSRISNTALSPGMNSGEMCQSSPSVGQWSSPDSLNPHITRAMKGCIEWPKGMTKHSLKAKLLEARIESQKIQLRHVLKQNS